MELGGLFCWEDGKEDKVKLHNFNSGLIMSLYFHRKLPCEKLFRL